MNIIVKTLKELLFIKRKYFILNILVAEGYGMLGMDYESFIDYTLEHKTDDEIVTDIKEMIEKSRQMATSLRN